jgi:predicted porin
MNKKTALALAVGALFAAPALAQTGTSSVEIYGRLYPQINWQKASGASEPGDVTATLVAGAGEVDGDHKGRASVDVANSRIGFRGREQLGGGMSAIWQIEQRVRFDTGAGNFWAGARNNFVGLSGGFGTVKLGLMDTIFKEYGAVVGNFFGVSSGNVVASSAVLPNHGLGVDGDTESGDTGFHHRAASTIQYETPEFGGFQAGIQYAPDERKGNPGRDFNTNLWSFGVKYEAGPLYASIHHERHNDWFDASRNIEAATGTASSATGSKDTGTRLSVGFAVTPQHRITGDLAQLQWKESGGVAGDFEKYKKRTWAVGWEARWGGPWRSELTYTKALEGDCEIVGGADCDTDGLEGSMVAAGVAYAFSKRTLVYVLATKLTNGDSAVFSQTANFDPNRGADTTVFALGVSHSF